MVLFFWPDFSAKTHAIILFSSSLVKANTVSTSSKFVLFTNFHFDTGGSGNGIRSRLTYNHSGISQTNVDSAYEDYGDKVSADRLVAFTSSHYYLAPSTTNEITFRLQFSNQGSGTVYLDRKTLRITAWEYA